MSARDIPGRGSPRGATPTKLLQLHRDSATYQKNLISKSGNYLIAASDQITIPPDHWIIRDNAQPYLIGDQENLPLMMTGSAGQFFRCYLNRTTNSLPV